MLVGWLETEQHYVLVCFHRLYPSDMLGKYPLKCGYCDDTYQTKLKVGRSHVSAGRAKRGWIRLRETNQA